MPTGLTIGLYPDRHRTLFDTLGEAFGLVVLENERGALPADAFSSEAAGWVEDLKRVGRGLGLDALPPESDELLRDKAMRVAHERRLVRTLHERRPLDFVLSSADYASSNRPGVLAARELGIPTICLDHGSLAILPDPDAYRPGHRFDYCLFCSDHLIVDNDLEKAFIERVHAVYPDVRHPRVQVLGVLLDTTPTGSGVQREESRRDLDLAPDDLVVTIAGTWYDLSTPQVSFRANLSDVRFYREAFKALAALRAERKVRVLLKLHPALSGFGAVGPVTRFARKVAAECGLEGLEVLAEFTPALNAKLLAASDLLLSPACSTFLWDGLLMGVPAIVFWPEELARFSFEPERLPQSTELTRAGCMTFVREPQELSRALLEQLAEPWAAEFRERRAALFQAYGVTFDSPRAKSLRIRHWIASLLAEPAALKGRG